ncbi:MAG TPA: helix-turn-helix domain-containing protein [Terriglobia bacterium]|nr:helix-turn-helix domain-containing protein [Terriglobia bacterium]
MAKRRSLSGESIREIKAAMKAARTADDLRRLLCVWLPEALGLSAAQTTQAVGWRASSVANVRGRYLRGGLSGLEDHRQPPLPPGTAPALAAALRRAEGLDGFRRIQCLLLRALWGLDAAQVGTAVGWARGTVSEVQSEYLRHGQAALAPARSAAGSAEAQKLAAAMKDARDVEELRRAQCLFLRVGLGYSSREVARIVGWRQSSVSHWHTRYLREGDAALRRPGRGRGRARGRWRLLSVAGEAEVLRRLARQASFNGLLEFSVIQRAFEEAAGHPVHPAVVVEILLRHGWAPGLVYVTPRQTRIPAEER